MSTLDAFRVLRVRELHVPPAGGFFVDLALDASTLPTLGALATLTVGDQAFRGAITISQFDDHPTGGAQPRVVLEGGAGWSKPLARHGAYSQPGGVRLLTVLADLAALAGEAYDPPPDFLLPPDYRWPVSTAREIATGRTALADLMVRGAIPTWRVDPATGRTRFDAWPSIGAADKSVRVLRRNLARGRRTVGLDTRVACCLPGSTLEGVTTTRFVLTETASKLQALVYGDPTPPLALWRQIVCAVLPWLEHVRTATDKGLSFRTAARLLHLEGDAGDPAVLRVGDVRALVFDPGVAGSLAPALYYTADGGATFVRVTQVAPGSTVGGTIAPPATTPNTALAPTGSSRVTCA